MELWIILVLVLLSTRSRGLKLVNLVVPAQTDLRSPVTLRCEHNLEGQSLYSVKWYKDEFEFFRYMPDLPNIRAFAVPGITLDLSRCNMSSVTLVNLSLNSSGNYKCEVSTEAPNFDTVASSANMTVLAFPLEDPVIEGVLHTYSTGDFVSANCTSPKSNPPATLQWHINGVQAMENTPEDDAMDAEGLFTKTIGLHFQVNRSQFRNGNVNLEIRCTATVGNISRYSTVTSALVRLTNQMLSQERVPSRSASTGSLKLFSASLICCCMALFTS